MHMKKLLVAALITATAIGAYAENTAGFQLSLVPDIAIQSRDTTIKGVSLGIWNENPGSQWQAGFVNGATGESSGLQSFIFFPTFFNYAESYTGVQMGFVNYASADFVGLQWGAVNYANSLTGVQWGAVNIASSVDGGFQWGVVNYAETANNLFQLGLVNIIADNAWFSNFPSDLAQGFVFVNWSFGE
jgi:hypothetical protein